MSEKKPRIAFCIPTKDRFNCIKEFLLDFPRIYSICAMDVFIYDSSTSDDVEKYVYSYDKTQNVHYIKVGDYSDEYGNIYKGTDQAALKLYNIYSEFSGSQMYDYVWVSGDGIRYSDYVLKNINELEDDFDLVSIENKKELVHQNRRIEIGFDPENYLRCTTVTNSLFGAILVNTKALTYLNWDEVCVWYKNLKYLSFAYLRLYAEIAMKSPKFKELTVFDECGMKWSIYKIDISWRKDLFDVFYDCYSNVVNSFPIGEESIGYIIDDMYDTDKDILNAEMLKYMRVKGVFGMKELDKWKKYIEYSLPYSVAYEIANTPPEQLIENGTNLKKDFIEFLESHNKIYIYGAGINGLRYQEIVEHNGYKIDGFIVTNKDNNPEYIGEYKVFVYDDIKDNIEEAGIILGLDDKNAKQVRQIIEKQIRPDNIYENYKYQIYIY